MKISKKNNNSKMIMKWGSVDILSIWLILIYNRLHYKSELSWNLLTPSHSVPSQSQKPQFLKSTYVEKLSRWVISQSFFSRMISLAKFHHLATNLHHYIIPMPSAHHFFTRSFWEKTVLKISIKDFKGSISILNYIAKPTGY